MWWYFVGVYVLAIGLAAYVLIDSLLPQRRERLVRLREPARLYPIAASVFLVCAFGVWIPAVPRPVSVLPIVLAPFALALGVAYLLRVVFPKPVVVDAVEGQTPGEAGQGSFADHEAPEK